VADFIAAWDVTPGHYICIRAGSPLGAVIRLFLRSPFDHVIIVTGPGEIVQATMRGVKRGKLSAFAGALAVTNADEPMTDAQRAAVVTAVKARTGDEYAFRLLPVIALRRMGFRWAWLLKASGEKDAVICSELAAEGGAAAGLNWLCSEPEPAMVTPAELSAREPFMIPVHWEP
jgi:hypothetical protein